MAVPPHVKRLRAVVGNELLLLPSVAVLAWSADGRLLLVRGIDSGRWQTVGGAVDPDESPHEAAVREAHEEAGVEVELTGLRGVVGGPEFKITYPNGDRTAYVSSVFDAVVTGGEPHPDHDETSETGWWAVDDLPAADLTPYTRALLTAVGVLPR